jgi:hypothetical protein
MSAGSVRLEIGAFFKFLFLFLVFLDFDLTSFSLETLPDLFFFASFGCFSLVPPPPAAEEDKDEDDFLGGRPVRAPFTVTEEGTIRGTELVVGGTNACAVALSVVLVLIVTLDLVLVSGLLSIREEEVGLLSFSSDCSFCLLLGARLCLFLGLESD